MGLFGMAFRRVRKLLAWVLAFTFLLLLAAGALYIVSALGVVG